MSSTVARLNVHVGADVTAMQAGFARAEGHITQFAGRVGSLGSLLSGALAGGSLVGGAGFALKMAADAEQAQVAFEVMLGSVDTAKKMLADLRAYAQVSPFSNIQVRESAQLLLNYGLAGDQVLPTIKTLADIAGGNAEKFHRLATAYGQSSSAGRLMGQDLLQMINAGFNPLQEISKRTGESMAELKKRMEDGAISTAEVQQAFVAATSAGGRFFGMTERQAVTLTGRWNTLVDKATNLATTWGTQLAPAAAVLIEKGIAILDWMTKLDPVVIGNVARMTALVGAFGAAILIVPRIIQAVTVIVGAFRQLATAQAIAHALSGPKGWLVLAGGLAAAAVATGLITQQFSKLDEGMKSVEKQAEKVNDKLDETKKKEEEIDFAKVWDEKMAKNAADWLAGLDKMRSAAASLTDSLKTPGEKIKDDFREAAELFQAGMIDNDTFERAADKARDELDKLQDDAEQFERKSIGANGRNTAAAFSAVQEATRNRDSINDSAKRAEQQRAETNQTLKDILTAVRSEEGRVNFNVADFG